jgi:hypothetical protein
VLGEVAKALSLAFSLMPLPASGQRPAGTWRVGLHGVSEARLARARGSRQASRGRRSSRAGAGVALAVVLQARPVREMNDRSAWLRPQGPLERSPPPERSLNPGWNADRLKRYAVGCYRIFRHEPVLEPVFITPSILAQPHDGIGSSKRERRPDRLRRDASKARRMTRTSPPTVAAGSVGLDAALAANLAVAVPPIPRARQPVELAQPLELAAAAAHLRAVVAEQPPRNVAHLARRQPGRIVGGSQLKISHAASLASSRPKLPASPLDSFSCRKRQRGVIGARPKNRGEKC